MKDNLSKKVIKGVKWSYLTSFVKFLLNLATVSVLAHLLKPEDFGVIALSISLINVLSAISSLGVGPTIIYNENINDKFIKTSFALTLFLGIFFFVILYFNASFFASFFKLYDFADVIKVMSISLIFININKVSYSLLRKNLKFKSIMISRNLSYFVSYTIIGVVFALLGFGLWALVFAYIMEKILFLLINYYNFKYPIIPIIYKKELKLFYKYGGWISVDRMLSVIANEGDYFIVSRIFGDKVLGFYERSFKLSNMIPNNLLNSLDRVLFPTLSIIKDKLEKLKTTFIHSSNLIIMIGLPISIFTLLTSPEIIIFLLGNKWSPAIPIFRIFSIFISLKMLILLINSLIKATGYVIKKTIYTAYYALMVLTFSLIGSHWGIEGASLGVLLAIFIYLGFLLYQSLEILDMTFLSYLKEIFNSILFSLFYLLTFITMLFFIRQLFQVLWMRFVILFLVAVVLYPFCLYVFLKKMELKSFKWILLKLDIELISKFSKIFFKVD